MSADLVTWLQGLGLSQYVDLFVENAIDMEVLPDLTDADLREMGVALGHRKKLLKAAAELDGSAESASLNEAGVSAPSAETAERRQLTVMFCDMVGYTELASGVDPEELQDIVRVYEDTCAAAITRYDGYVFQRLGDGIVAFFGYPLAHEGEAERAIRAGLDIIDAFGELEVPNAGRLKVRIGIATGMVVVTSAEKGAVGETMNLAARLQGVAPVNTIVVSESVRQLAAGAFAYEDLGQQVLKGIGRPTHAYRIADVRQLASRFEAASGESLTPLVGRDLELGLLMDRWARAQDGEGQVVLLSGEPGIGKSRILSALRERLEAQDVKSLRFQCSPYYANTALWPSINNFERALNFARDEAVESKLDKLESLIVGHYERPLEDVRFVASMLSIPCEARYGQLAMTPQKFKDETLRTLVDLTEAAAKKRPSVMLFEDLHWADPTTLEVLDLAIARVKTLPLLIVLTGRPEFENLWSDHQAVSLLDLARLTRSQSRALVLGVSGGKKLPDDLLEQILDRTDGIPLFVEELTKAVLESGELKEEADRYEYVGNVRSFIIPVTLRDSLMARLDRYLPVKEVAQIGAAIGREFSYELLSQVAPMPKAKLDKALAQLIGSGLVFVRGAPPAATYTFKHALVQDAAYDSLLKSRRQQLHGKIAEAIEARFPETAESEPEVLAHHLTIAGDTHAAIPLWQKAGESAMGHMALSEAISYLNRGLSLVSSLEPSNERDAHELTLRTPLGIAWMGLKGWADNEVWNSFQPGLALARALDRKDAMLPILWGMFINVMCQGRVAESIAWAHEILDVGGEAGAADYVIAGHNCANTGYFWNGDMIKTRHHGEMVQALYDSDKHRHLVDLFNLDPKTMSGIFASISTWILGYPDEAVRLNNDACAHARERGHPFDLGWALSVGADVFDLRCDPDVLHAHASESEQIGYDNSLPFLWAALAPIRIGMALIRKGEIANGLAQFSAGRDIWVASGGQVYDPYFKSILAECMALTGDLDEALRRIDDAVEQVNRPGWEERLHYAEILRLRGWIMALRKNAESAEQNFLASLDWAREQKAKSWELRTSTSLARLWQSQGRQKEAHDLLAPVYNWFTEGFDTKDLKDAKALLEELAA